MSGDFLDPRRAERLSRAARAAQTLSEMLWEALQEELSAPHSERVTELTEQLREVAATVGSLARVGGRVRAESTASEGQEPHAGMHYDDSSPEQSPSSPGWPAGREPSAIPEPLASREPPGSLESPASGEPSGSLESPVSDGPSGSRESPASDESSGSRESPASGEPSGSRESPASREWTGGQEPPARAVLVDELAAEGVRTPIEIRDERRGEDGPAAWIGSIGRRLERYEHDAAPFAVLLVELVDVDRLRRAEPAGELARLTEQLEAALARQLRPADSLTRESPGRYWLLTPQTDKTGAQLLAERVAHAVRSSASHRGAPFEVAVGIAVCPDDGRQASQLAAHADVALYAARAAGRLR